MRTLISDYLRLMRIPSLLGMALPLIFGAISVNIFSPFLLIPLFIIGGLSGIYGFVLNDYIDSDLDKTSKELSKRPLVNGKISKKTAKVIIFTCFIGAYLTVFIFFYRFDIIFFTGLIFLIIADILAGVYNLYGKVLIGSDFLLALAQSLYFLFGAVMVLQNESINVLTWVFFVLIFTQMLYMNAFTGGIKDADHDFHFNVKNIALSSGVRINEDNTISIPLLFKIFGVGLRCFFSILIFFPYVFYNIPYESHQIIILIALVFSMLYFSIEMFNTKQFNRTKLRKSITIQLFIWYLIAPVMLLSVADTYSEIISIIFFLIIIPLMWYISFTLLINDKIFEPNI